MKKIILVFQCLIILSCSQNEKPAEIADERTDANTVSTDTLRTSESEQKNLKQLNDQILQILKQGNHRELANFIHPRKGVRFSMYAYIEPAKDKVFTREDFIKYINSNVKFTWGQKDGTGEIYQTTLKNYLEEWVYSRDFSKSDYSENEMKGKGNTINNLKEIYPNADFTENYINGSEQYSFMDWNSLRFVFEKLGNKYYLTAVVNDQWTI